MIRSRASRRAVFGEKLLDLANYTAAALAFGQFVAPQPMSWQVMLAGIATWLVLAGEAYRLTGER